MKIPREEYEQIPTIRPRMCSQYDHGDEFERSTSREQLEVFMGVTTSPSRLHESETLFYSHASVVRYVQPVHLRPNLFVQTPSSRVPFTNWVVRQIEHCILNLLRYKLLKAAVEIRD